MIYRHSDEQIQNYFSTIAINQSALKVILNDGIQLFMLAKEDLQREDDLFYEEKKHFIVGSAIDCYITQGEEAFLSKYHFSKLTKKPGVKAMSVIRLAYERAREEFPLGVDIDITAYSRLLVEACDTEGYYMNRRNKDGDYNLDTRVAQLLRENAQEYWSDICLAEGKQILSDDEQTVINAIITSLTTHKHTASFFQDREGIDVIFQTPIYFEYEGVECKIMVDIIIIDHNRRRIIPIDLKTTGVLILKFPNEIPKRRYDLQASYYTYGISKGLSYLSELVKTLVNDYTIANFAFIAESTVKPGCPLVFVLGDDLLERGRVGNDTVQGWTQAIDIYKSWLECDFSIEKKYEKTNGILFLDTSTI